MYNTHFVVQIKIKVEKSITYYLEINGQLIKIKLDNFMPILEI